MAAATSTTNRWLVLILLSSGFFMIQLDVMIVNIAIPSIIDDLKASLDQILWVLNAYILVYAILLITAGRLGDLFGQRNLFVLGLGVFTVSSAACGLAPNIDLLIAARVAQGLGGALLTPQTLSIITTLFPSDNRGAAFGIWGAVAGIASIAGPTLGGFLVTDASWRWIFFINVPIGLVVVVAGLVLIPDLRPGHRHGFDPIGMMIASAALFLITFGLIEGQRYDWAHVTNAGPLPLPAFVDIRLILVAGAVLAVAFLLWEGRHREALVPLSLFSDRNYSLMNWVVAIVSFAMVGLFLPFVIYLQSVLGFSAMKAGLTMVPMTAATLPVAPLAGKLADRFGGKYLIVAGLAVMGLGIALFDQVAAADSDWYSFVLVGFITGVGMGMTFAPMTTVAMRNISPEMAGAASGVFNTTRQLGGVLGSAIVGAVLQNQLAQHLRDEAVRRSTALPAPLRGPFVDAFASAAKNGFQVGRSQVGAAVPGGLPPQLAHQLQAIAHDVFVYGYLDAMRVTLVVPILAIALGAISCLAVRRRMVNEAREAARPTPA